MLFPEGPGKFTVPSHPMVAARIKAAIHQSAGMSSASECARSASSNTSHSARSHTCRSTRRKPFVVRTASSARRATCNSHCNTGSSDGKTVPAFMVNLNRTARGNSREAPRRLATPPPEGNRRAVKFPRHPAGRGHHFPLGSESQAVFSARFRPPHARRPPPARAPPRSSDSRARNP